MRIDSHQHFWQYDASRDTWIEDHMKVIRQDFLPNDLSPILKANGIDGCVVVQADPSDAETLFLLELAAENDFIKGIVGWADLTSASLPKVLDNYQASGKLKGFRHILQAEPTGFMENPSFINGVKTLFQYRYTYDILVFHYQLPEVIDFIKKLPPMGLVLDHLGKPDILNNNYAEWKSNLKKLSDYRNLFIKLSGLVTEANWKLWKQDNLKKYIDTALDLFGLDRVMFGSDWPVCLLAANYEEVIELVEDSTAHLTQSEKDKIFGGNAINFYSLT